MSFFDTYGYYLAQQEEEKKQKVEERWKPLDEDDFLPWIPIRPKKEARKLKAKWTLEAAQDLKAWMRGVHIHTTLGHTISMVDEFEPLKMPLKPLKVPQVYGIPDEVKEAYEKKGIEIMHEDKPETPPGSGFFSIIV